MMMIKNAAKNSTHFRQVTVQMKLSNAHIFNDFIDVTSAHGRYEPVLN